MYYKQEGSMFSVDRPYGRQEPRGAYPKGTDEEFLRILLKKVKIKDDDKQKTPENIEKKLE